jgi:hypothetical protein
MKSHFQQRRSGFPFAHNIMISRHFYQRQETPCRFAGSQLKTGSRVS